jgi:hypothetical protein
MSRVSLRASAPLCVVILLLAVIPVSAQTATASAGQQSAGPRPGEIETAPIRCWWKTDRTSIRVGERFALTLTCSVIETRSVTVVPTLTQLDPGALQIPPFEVVGGSRRDDVVAPPWRYVQYEYTVRFLGEGYFGQDLTIPPLSVTYAIRAASGNGAEGRDLSYVLPAIPLRVMSLVPRDTEDIRDASAETFVDVEARRFRSRTALIVSGILFAASVALVLIAVVRLIGRSRNRQRGVVREMPAALVLNACVSGLKKLGADVARDGWSPVLARRASGMLRIASAIALGRPVAQMPVERAAPEREGQVVVNRGLLRRRPTAVSAATTPHAIAKALENGHRPSGAARATLDQLRGSLDVLSPAGYGRSRELDLLTLNTALEQGTEAVKRLRMRALMPARVLWHRDY